LELIAMLRDLWRFRGFVAVAALVALCIGWITAFRPSFPPEGRHYTVGIATARILVDTPRSQVVEVAPRGSEMLGSRASVLAQLMVDGQLKADIARRAGLPRAKLSTRTQGAPGEELAPTPAGPDAYVLTTGVLLNSDLAQLPIIKAEAQAPNPAQAAMLANAAVEGLSDYLDSKAATEQVPDRQRLSVSGLGPAQAHEVTRGTSAAVTLALTLFAFLAGCGVILATAGLVRGWRQAAETERSAVDDAAFPRLVASDPDDHSAEAPTAGSATAVEART
jgi:hypothetical protein